MPRTILPHLTPEIETRFWKHVLRGGPDDCWMWLSSRNRKGYGHFGVPTLPQKPWQTTEAHRFSWVVAARKDIPDGMCVCHTCDHPGCVNPNHLFVGTIQDNNKDRCGKQRTSRKPRNQGTKNHFSRLNEESVQKIRHLCDSGEANFSAIGRDFGVSSNTISRIAHRDTWRSVHQTSPSGS